MTSFPRMALVEQRFPRPKVENVEETVQAQLREVLFSRLNPQGKHIAVSAGSRGITHIDRVTRATVDLLKSLGAQPFIIPAMGSHGGGTEEGQRAILADYGITEEAMGASIDTRLETVALGKTAEGFPVFLARSVVESDGVIMINRIKPHTDFHGAVESGLLKMIAIGLGKIEGALTFHSAAFDYPHSEMILSIGRAAIQTGKILGGVALLENAYHETARIHVLRPEHLEERERILLPHANSLMPSLPVEKADVLIVDQLGKNISGVGIDPNITGRCYRLNSCWNEKPDITRIVVLDITEATQGNAVGLGLADFVSRRVVDKMDKKKTYLNSIVSRNVICASIPPYFDTDREVMNMTIMSLREGTNADNLRLLRIENTLSLTRLYASEALLPELRDHPNIASIGELQEMEFDEEGNLTPEFEGVEAHK